MGYSYFPTRRSAEKWVRENLDSLYGDKVTIDYLRPSEQTDYSKWYAYYPLRAIK